MATLNAKEERLVNLSRKISSINFESTIKLNIGGIIYQTSLGTLTKYSGSLLADMFSTRVDLKQGNDGCYFIDRDGTHFRHVLNYLRSGKAPVLSVLKTDAEEILEEAEYYGLVGLVRAINNELNGDDDTGRKNIKGKDEIAIIDGMEDETKKELFATKEKLESCLKLLDANLKVLDEATNHHKEVSKTLSTGQFGENVKIDVGGRIFKTSLKTLRKESESVLASMFSEKLDLKKEDDGSFFIDRDGTFFHHILDYLRDGKVSEGILEEYGSQMQREAEYYGLSSLKEQIHNYTHVKLNVGGADFVVTREVLKQYPDSMFGRMLSGKACAFKKIEDGSFYIVRDGTNFHHILKYLRYGIISDDIIRECGVSLHDDAKFYMLPCLEKRIENYNNVKVNVGGREFVISRKMLNKFKESMLGKMLGGEHFHCVERSDGSYVVQHDSTNFAHILDYLRSGSLSDDVIEQDNASLLADAEFYMLPGLKDQINYHTVKLSIDGRDFVVSKRVLNKFPDSLFGWMLAGKKGNYVKRSDGLYFVQRDGRNFHHILTYLRSGTLSEDVIDQHTESLLADAEFYMLPGLRDQINYHNVKLSIDGREFVVSRRVLNKFPDSLFGWMLAGKKGNYVKRSDGLYFVQRDGRKFHHILTYLRSGTLSEDVIKQDAESLLADAEFYMLPCLKDQINYHIVKLSIGGRELFVSKGVLNTFPDSLFGRMLAGQKGKYVKRHDGSYFVQRNGRNFHHILTYLRSGTLSEDVIEQHAKALLDDADFYMLPGLKDQINYHIVKLSIGSREFFVMKRVLNKFPDSMFARMLAGEDGNYVKRSDESYLFQRDGKNFHHILTYLSSGTLSEDVIEQHAEALLADADYYMLPGLKYQINYHIVKLSIGGRELFVSKGVLNKFPDSLFGMMLAGKKGNYVKRHDGSYFVQRNGTNFHHILTYLRFGKPLFCCTEQQAESLLDDAEFYMLPGLKDSIKRPMM